MDTGGFFVAVLQRRTDGEKPRQDESVHSGVFLEMHSLNAVRMCLSAEQITKGLYLMILSWKVKRVWRQSALELS
jgi:hypothetical protein